MSSSTAPSDATVWFVPLRVNLRYSPATARVTLTGRLLGTDTGELRKILQVLRTLSAPLEIDVRAVRDADAGGVGVLVREIAERCTLHLPPVRVGPRRAAGAPQGRILSACRAAGALA